MAEIPGCLPLEGIITQTFPKDVNLALRVVESLISHEANGHVAGPEVITETPRIEQGQGQQSK